MKHDVQSLTVKRSPDNETTYEANMETFAQSCKPNSMLYNVTISFPRGVRQIQHTLSDARPVPDPVDVYDIDSQYIELDLPAEPQTLRTWNQKVLAAIPVSNEWALLDALGSVLDAEWYTDSMVPSLSDCTQRDNSGDGTTTHECFSISLGTYPSGNNTSGKSPVLLVLFDHNC
jgi:hypothetical protein